MHIRSKERAGGDPLLSTAVLKNRTANIGMVTQNLQWLTLMGMSFVVSVFLQVIRGYSAIQTGVIFTATTVGVLISSAAAGRLAKTIPSAHPDRLAASRSRSPVSPFCSPSRARPPRR